LKVSNKKLQKIMAGLPVSFVALGIIFTFIWIAIILWLPLLQWL